MRFHTALFVSVIALGGAALACLSSSDFLITPKRELSVVVGVLMGIGVWFCVRADKMVDTPDVQLRNDAYEYWCPPIDSLEQIERIWREFHDAGMSDLWYASAHPIGVWRAAHYGPRWHAGVWTGPDNDLICVHECATKAEAEKCLSPGAWTPEEAAALALEKLERLTGSRKWRCTHIAPYVSCGDGRTQCSLCGAEWRTL